MNEIVDLYAIGFDLILRPRDNPSWLTETIPDDMLDRMDCASRFSRRRADR